MDRTLRFGILGTGHMAQTMAHCLRGLPGVSIAGFVSRDPARARAIGAAHGASASYETFAAMLADTAVDAVYIVNDNAGHAAAAIAALEAGKAVLCEKPCGVNLSEARALAETAARTGSLFMEAIATPFLPAVSAALDAGRDGRLGTLRHLSATFGYPASPASHAGAYAQAGGGVLLDRGIYLVTLALLALGPVKTIEARISRDAEGIDTEAWMLLTHEGGATSTLGVSLLSQLDNRLSLAGTNGTAMVEAPLLAAERMTIALHGEVGRAPPPSNGLTSRLKQSGALRRMKAAVQAIRAPYLSYGASLYAPEIAHFRDLVLAGAAQSPVLPPSLSVEAMAILDAVRAQTA